MKYEVPFDPVLNVQIKVKDSEAGISASISFDSPGQPVNMARLVALMATKAPIVCTFTSNQSAFDLDLIEASEKVSAEKK